MNISKLTNLTQLDLNLQRLFSNNNFYLSIITNNYSWGYENKNISNEGIKELGLNLSKLINLTQLNLNLRG